MARDTSGDDRPTPVDRLRESPGTVRLYLLAAIGLGVTALYGGANLVADPTGSSLAMDVAMLEGTPFGSFLLPGAILLGVLGVGSFVTVAAVATGHRWAWPATLGLAAALVGWIAVQVALLGSVHWLHVAYGGLGVAMAVLAVAPSTRASLGGQGR